jgi:hypothetical protein
MTTNIEKFRAMNARWIDAFNAMDGKRLIQYLDEMYTRDYVAHFSFPAEGGGPTHVDINHEAMKQYFREYVFPYSSYTITYDDQITEGNTIATRYTTRWTNKSDGKKEIQEAMSFVRIDAEGQCAEEWQVVGPSREDK